MVGWTGLELGQAGQTVNDLCSALHCCKSFMGSLTLSAGSVYSEAVDVEELQAQEGPQLPSLSKRFQQALTRGEAAFNGGFTDAAIRLGNLLKVRAPV